MSRDNARGVSMGSRDKQHGRSMKSRDNKTVADRWSARGELSSINSPRGRWKLRGRRPGRAPLRGAPARRNATGADVC